MVCLAPRALEDSMRPRRSSGTSGRPFNFTVRGRNQIRLCSESDQGEVLRQRPFVLDCGSARGPSARPCVISSASAAFVADAAAVKGEVPLRQRGSCVICRRHADLFAFRDRSRKHPAFTGLV